MDNSRGKEYYYENGIKFEGEYLKGKQFKGKEFNREKNLIYEGEYLHGKKWNGNLFNKNGNIISEIKNGKGFVKEYENDNKILKVNI